MSNVGFVTQHSKKVCSIHSLYTVWVRNFVTKSSFRKMSELRWLVLFNIWTEFVMSKWYLLIAMIFFCNMSLDPHGMNRGTILVFEQKKWGDIPRYAHILLYFWPETYTQKEEIRKHDLICYFVYLYFKILFFCD